MVAFERYSLREKRLNRQGEPQILHYDNVPIALRTQAYLALVDAVGKYDFRQPFSSDELKTNRGYGEPFGNWVWRVIEFRLQREIGTRAIARPNTPEERFYSYLVNLKDDGSIVDAIEEAFRVAVACAKVSQEPERWEAVKEAVDSVNRRFLEHDLGFQFVPEALAMFRIDSQFVFAEMIQPAISQLARPNFQGPLDQFTRAHLKYRNSDYSGAVIEANNAFESTMKAIIDARGWKREESWNVSNLVRALIQERLLPVSSETYLNGVRIVFANGVPTIRRDSAHGKGGEVTKVEDYQAAFALNLAATNIVLLMSAFDALPPLDAP